MIKKTLVVQQLRNHAHKRDESPVIYKVIQVVNSITPRIGDFIEAYDLQELYCDIGNWTVTIKGK